MLELKDPKEVRRICDLKRREGMRIGFVPTMGFLHEGHLALIRSAKARSQFVVVSIFVNPSQFGPQEDFASYPRDLQSDLEKCRREGVNCVFIPEAEVLYPKGFQTWVEVAQISLGMCGSKRPGHFRGVCTIVTKLFNMIGPCVAVFGEKDYQQLAVIRQMAKDLNQPVEIFGHPTVREDDGLAMSSRNAYLGAHARGLAPSLFKALLYIRDEVRTKGSLSVDEIISKIKELIVVDPHVRIDYIEVRDAETLDPVQRVGEGRVVVALAAFLGNTRLIDNIIIES